MNELNFPPSGSLFQSIVRFWAVKTQFAKDSHPQKPHKTDYHSVLGNCQNYITITLWRLFHNSTELLGTLNHHEIDDVTWKSEMAERSRVAFNYQPFRDHYVVYSVLYPYNKNKSFLQLGSIKTLSVEVYQISYHSRISYSSNQRQQATANKFVRRVFR